MDSKHKYSLLFSFLNFLNLHQRISSFQDEYPAENHDLNNAFQHCLNVEPADSLGNTLHCMKKEFLINIANADELECVEVLNGVSLLRDENDKEPRTIFPVYTDGYGSILESAAAFIGRRFIKWDMSLIHPGLIMRVGPLLNGAGVLEFVMERGHPTYSDRTIGTGRLIVRRLLLPLLMGVKLKVATLLPILIIILIIVSKKALILSKFAVLLTSIVGVNAFSNFHQQNPTYSTIENVLGNSFLSTFPRIHEFHNEENKPYPNYFNDDQLQSYRSPEGGKQINEQRRGRNFVWEKSQK